MLSQAYTLWPNWLIVPAAPAWVNSASRATTSSQRAKACGVETPTGGVTTTRCIGGKVGQRINLLARDPTPSTVPPIRNSGRSLPTSAAMRKLVFGGELHAQRPLQRQHGRDGIRRGRPHSALHRQLLLDLDDDFAVPPAVLAVTRSAMRQHVFDCIGRYARIFAANLNARTPLQIDLDDVMQRDRLIDGAQLVKAVSAAAGRSSVRD